MTTMKTELADGVSFAPTSEQRELRALTREFAENEIRPKAAEYDDSRWSREELHALAWEAGKAAGWEDMGDYDDAPETP